MRGRIGSLSLILGVALILCALGLFSWNQWEDRKAGESAESIVEQIREIMDGAEAEEEDEFFDESELPEMEIDGYPYIGTLTIPSLDRELPVMSEWDYTRLRISPCRYAGSPLTDDFVICAHNYERHFGTIKNLTEGAQVIFTAMDGRVWTYQVACVDVYEPTDVGKMVSGKYDLMLFTCTYGGKTRVAVGCELVSRSMPE